MGGLCGLRLLPGFDVCLFVIWCVALFALLLGCCA